MDDFAPTQAMVETFLPTRKSPMARARVWLWILAALAVGVAAVAATKSGAGGWIAISLILLGAGALDHLFRRQRQRDQAPLLLSLDSIESAGFRGKKKRFLWQHVAKLSVEPNAAGNVLQLELTPAGDTDERPGARKGRAVIPLHLFSAPEQERLLDVAIRLLHHTRPEAAATNTLTEEREFRERLIALAPRTWVTYSLVLINVAIWLLMVFKGVDVVRPSVAALLQWGGSTASEVQKGQWWRMLTATFLHGGLVHLLMNMVGLWSIGQTTERLFGHRLFLLVYLGSALGGSALSLNFSAQQAVAVGASGAVFGIAGALLVAVYQHRQSLPRLFGKQNLTGMGFFVVYSLVQGFTHNGIDNAAHIGGLVVGCLMASILPKRIDPDRYAASLRRRTISAVAAAASFCIILAAVAPPAPIDVQRALSGAAAFEKGAKAFDEASKRMQQLQAQVKAGRLTELEMDNRSRSEFAPAYRAVQAELAKAWLPPGDPRRPFLLELQHLTGLLVETLAMDSVVDPGTSRITPVDPVRWEFLNAETSKSAERLRAMGEQFKADARKLKR